MVRKKVIHIPINPQTNQYLTQLNTLRYIDVSSGPNGAQGVTSYWLIPTNGYHHGVRMPHEVVEDLAAQDHKKTTHEGLEYYLVPEESSNVPGILSHYAQRTGVAELQNPPGGGVNRARETFIDNSASATVDPESVRKYVDTVDSWEEARKKQSEEDERTARQVHASVPAREPADGKLTTVDSEGEAEVAPEKTSIPPAPKQSPAVE